MTQAEMDADLADARSYLSCTSLTVDRCRHESVDASSIWIFDGFLRRGERNQIASLTRDYQESNLGATHWHLSLYHRGVMYAQTRHATTLDALGAMMRATKESVSWQPGTNPVDLSGMATQRNGAL